VDAAWRAGAEHLHPERGDLPLIVDGPFFGGRVACRTATDVGASGVLCFAFPVHPPGRPEKSRLSELTAVTVPTLVVQGDHDPSASRPRDFAKRNHLGHGVGRPLAEEGRTGDPCGNHHIAGHGDPVNATFAYQWRYSRSGGA